MRVMIHILAVLVIALASSGIADPVAAAEPAMGVYPAYGAPGTRFGFVADGFQRHERIAVWMNTPDGRVLTEGIENLFPASREGRVTWNWNAPADASFGTWQMVVHGLRSGMEYVIPFEIRAAEPAPIEINVQPRTGRPGTLFIFYATGFQVDEAVQFWANTPDGRAIEIEPVRVRLFLGRADWSWDAPLDAIPGTWQIVAHGLNSGVERVLTFEIQ